MTERRIAMPCGVLSASLLVCGTLGLTCPAFAAEDHVLIPDGKVDYSAGPPSLPEGAEFAVLYGDPTAEGPFALRLKLPGGYHIPPHIHPRAEVVTVISGVFELGMGAEPDSDAAQPLAASLRFRQAWCTTPTPTERRSCS